MRTGLLFGGIDLAPPQMADIAQQAEAAELRDKVEASGMPDEVKSRALKELDRMARIPSASPEVGVIRTYVDWLIAGLLAMNMMFSALFGVGYNIVRYRKTGVLKRLKAAPLRAAELLAAAHQVHDPAAGSQQHLDLAFPLRRLGRGERRLDLDGSDPLVPAHPPSLRSAALG
mgnify:CR=1 FL=1